MLYNLKVLFYLETLLVVGLFAYRAALLPSFRGVVGPKAVVLMLAVPAVAMLGTNLYLFHAFLFCAVAFTSRTRRELCATYLLLLPMMPALQLDLWIGSLYVLALPSFATMNAGVLVGLALTAPRGARADVLLSLSMAVLVVIFTYIDSRGVTATAVLRLFTQSFLLLAPPYLLAARAAADAEDLRRLYLSLCLSGFLGAVTAIFIAVRRWDLYESFYGALGVVRIMGSTAMAVRGGFLRAGGPVSDYTAYGLFAAVALLVLLASRAAFRRNLFPPVAGVFALGLVAAQSRGAWIAFLAGYAVLAAMRGQRARALTVVAVPALLLPVLGAVLGPSSRLADVLGISGGAASTGEYRQLLLSRGLEQVAAHPLLGQSPERLIAALPDLVQGQHIVDFVNTHLYVAMAAGVPAFLVWALVWSGAVARLMRRRHQGTREVRRSSLLVVPAAAIVAAMVALTFTSTIDRNLVWPMVALGLATPALVPAGSRMRRRPDGIPAQAPALA